MTYRNRILREQAKAAHWTPMDSGIAATLLDAMSTKESAKALGLAPKTIEDYRLRLKRRMGARNLVDLALKLADVAREGMA